MSVALPDPGPQYSQNDEAQTRSIIMRALQSQERRATGVTAGAYGSSAGTVARFTVDQYGRLTAASNHTLVAADIPDLSASYVTPTSLTSTLSAYTTTAALTAALVPYATTAAVAAGYLPLAGGTLTGVLNIFPASGTVGGITVTTTGAGTSNLNLTSDSSTGVAFQMVTATANGNGTLFRGSKARGMAASPTAVSTNDVSGSIQFRGHSGSGYVTQWQEQVTTIEATPGSSAMGARLIESITNTGSTSLTEVRRMQANGWYAFGANLFLDNNRVSYPQALAPAKQRIAPSTGFSQTIANNTDTLAIHGASTLATGTITMPASPVDGHVQNIITDVTITALTLSPNTGQTLCGTIPTTMTADTPFKYKWSATDSNWKKTL